MSSVTSGILSVWEKKNCNWPLREIGRECWPKAERGGSLDLVGAPILASKTFSQANSKTAGQLKKKHIAKNTVSDIS